MRLLLYHAGDLNKVKLFEEHFIITVMKDYPIDWHVKCSQGHTTLYYACKHNNKEMVDYLTDMNVSLDSSEGLSQDIIEHCHRKMKRKEVIHQDTESIISKGQELTKLLIGSKSMM